MLKLLTQSAIKNVFESARFYYYLLWCLVGYSMLREIVQKSSLVYRSEPIFLPREIIGSLFFVFAFCSTISFLMNNRKWVGKLSFFVVIILISLTNEIRAAINFEKYSFYYSVFSGQLYYVIKVIFPLMFFNFWTRLDYKTSFSKKFISVLETLFIINAVLIFFGALFGVTLMESYPLSIRWGYCGILMHRAETQFVYGFLLLYNLNTKKPISWKAILFAVCMLMSGQKSVFLWFALILFFVVLKKLSYRVMLISVIAFASAIFPLILEKLINFSIFWRSVYDDYGVWGVFFSTRDIAFLDVMKSALNEKGIVDWAIGNISRYPFDVEMLIIDLFVFFATIGVLVFLWFLKTWLPTWKWSIPIFVVCLVGGIFGIGLTLIIYGVFLNEIKKSQYHSESF